MGNKRFLSIYTFYFWLILSFFFFSCTRTQEENLLKSNRYSNKYIEPKVFTPGKDTIPLPIVVRLDSCPKPKQFDIPNKPGNFYSITYTNGETVKIDLLPPVKKHLAQQPGDAQGGGFFTTYTTDDGLAYDQIHCTYKDSNGNLWIGTNGGGISRFNGKSFTNFTKSQGLLHNSIRSICEDNNGNFWFSFIGSGEVGIYDGKAFNTINFSKNEVIRIYKDKKGSLWFGTWGEGVYLYNGKEFKRITTSDGLASNIVISILEDRNGNMWFGTWDGGLSCYNGEIFKNITKSQGMASNSVLSMCEDDQGNLWFGTQGGVSCYNGSDFINYTTSQGLTNNVVNSISIDKNEKLWFGTDDGVSCYDGKTFINYSTSNGLSNNTIYSISEDNNGNLWFGTWGGGVCCYQGESFVNYTTSHGLSDNIIWSICQDRNKNLWLPYWGKGVSCFDGDMITNYTMSQGLADDHIGAAYEDIKGNIWFGTWAGISCFNGKSIINYNTDQGIGGNSVGAFCEDNKGNLWFNTSAGLCYFDGKSFVNYSTSQGLVSNYTSSSIYKDKHGNLWIGTYDGISCYNGKSFTNFNTSHGLVDNVAFSFGEDNNGNLWIGTVGGLSIAKYAHIQKIINRISKTENKKINLNPETKDNLKNRLFTNFTIRNGLGDNTITAIRTDNSGNIILGTNQGVTFLSPIKEKAKSFIPTLKVGDQLYKIDIYNTSTGYPIKDINSGNNGSMIINDKNIIWSSCGSDKIGLVRFDYNALNKNSNPPVVELQKVKINNENIGWYDLASYKNLTSNQTLSKSDLIQDSLAIINEEVLTFEYTLDQSEREALRKKFGDINFEGINRFNPVPKNLELPYQHNNITFEFAANELIRPYLVKYQYMLEGYDEDWNPITNNATASYGNMYEGKYTFKVRAIYTGPSIDKGNDWSKTVTYVFKVLPPWYRTWWMYIIYFVASVISLYVIYRWRIKALLKEKKILERKVKERTSELQQANEEITSQRDEIEAQRDEIEAQRDMVTIQKNQIEKNHKEVTDSINYAKRIQQAVLPDNIKIEKLLPFEFFVLFKPKDIVSGDFYFVEKINNYLVIAVADCTGHGVPGAFLSMLGLSFLTEIIAKEEFHNSGDILNELRNYIINSLQQKGKISDQKDGLDVSLVLLNLDTLELQYSGANNPLYIIQRQGSISPNSLEKVINPIVELKPNKMPVAIHYKMKPFDSQNIKLKKGDVFYLLSDGYQDQFGGEKGKKFMSKNLKELLVKISDKSMAEQNKILEDKLFNWMNWNGDSYEQIDDITIFGVKL